MKKTKRSATGLLASVAAGVIAVCGIADAKALDAVPDASDEERPTVAYFGLGQTTCPYFPEPGGPCSPV